MEARIARLESDVAHLRSDVGEMKTDVRALRDRMDTRVDRLESKMDSQFIWLISLHLALAAGIFVAVLRVPSFIVTLAALIGYSGLVLHILLPNTTIDLFLPSMAMMALAMGSLGAALFVGYGERKAGGVAVQVDHPAAVTGVNHGDVERGREIVQFMNEPVRVVGLRHQFGAKMRL